MSDDKLRWIFDTRDDEQLAARYDAWASDYDADHEQWGWVGPARATQRLRALLDPVIVLDAGCGTGGVGRVLRDDGWSGQLTGVDLSEGMLARARAGGWYDELIHGSLTALPFDDASMDAYVATGVYTHGHVGPEGFPEAIRVVRPGGLIVVTLREEVWAAVEPDASRLEAAGRWVLVERTDLASFHPGKGEGDDKPQSVAVWRRT